jgi:tripartite-type tricarboxylate transporter receptor subunit TctC
VAKAKPDGYTLQIVTGSFTIFPALYNNLPFDTLNDLAPIFHWREADAEVRNRDRPITADA